MLTLPTKNYTITSRGVNRQGTNYIKFNQFTLTGNLILTSTGAYENITQIIPNINLLNIINLLPFLQKVKANKDILLVGCGSKFIIPNTTFKQAVLDLGFTLEWVQTPPAINIWNLLLEDYRDVVFVMIW